MCNCFNELYWIFISEAMQKNIYDGPGGMRDPINICITNSLIQTNIFLTNMYDKFVRKMKILIDLKFATLQYNHPDIPILSNFA